MSSNFYRCLTKRIRLRTMVFYYCCTFLRCRSRNFNQQFSFEINVTIKIWLSGNLAENVDWLFHSILTSGACLFPIAFKLFCYLSYELQSVHIHLCSLITLKFVETLSENGGDALTLLYENTVAEILVPSHRVSTEKWQTTRSINCFILN